MRKRFLTLACIFLLCAVSLAQDCKSFLFMTSNAEIQMSIFDKKGNVNGIQTWKISDVKRDGAGYSSTINSRFTDEKGKEIAKGTGVYKCNGGMLQADMKMAMPQQSQMQSSDVQLSDSYLEYPYNLSVGQGLKDAQMEMDVNMNTGIKANINFKEINRKVDSKESITTPAGTWEAYVISYEGNMRTKMGPIGIPFNFTAKEWFVPGIGIVKTETYSKGKLAGSTMITSIKK
jgi:hypothetical protein